MDVSHRALETAHDRLHSTAARDAARAHPADPRLADLPRHTSGRLRAAAVVEVIEHLDPPRLAAFERVLFEYARPGTVVVTTPNREYNVRFRDPARGTIAPPRPPLRVDARGVSGVGEARRDDAFGYSVRFLPIGREDAEVGPPTQMAVFTPYEASTASPNSRSSC